MIAARSAPPVGGLVILPSMSTTPDDTRFMQLALDRCRRGVERGQSPFGAVIVAADGSVLAAEHNAVRLTTDATAHAEVNAIRVACRTAEDIHLPGSTIYTTTEPCPMCFTAIHWARIRRIVYGASVQDAKSFGFHELQISNDQMKTIGVAEVEITPHFMRDEALALFELWKQTSNNPY